MMKMGFTLMCVLVIATGCRPVEPKHQITLLELDYPAHFPEPTLPLDNELSEEGVLLGRHLFYDVRLSGDNTQSCNSCHRQESNFAEPTAYSTGIDGVEGDINAMVLSNLAWQDFFFWDGRDASLEDQVKEPIVNPIEMHSEWPDVIDKIEQDLIYNELFLKAFGTTEVSKENVANALSQFIRTLVSGTSSFDAYVDGNYSFTPSEQKGFDLFNGEKGDCFHCHGLATTGYQMGAYGLLQFSNNGLDSLYQIGDGREAVTGSSSDRGKFKIPSLRNIEYSFPYMHDGRFETLAEVVDFYNTGGHLSATIDPNMKAAGSGRNWSEIDKKGLLDFMKTFSDPNFLTDTSYSNPW